MTVDETNRCEYSTITIPNDAKYIAVARAYVDSVAEILGFDRSDRGLINRALEEGVANVMAHAFDPEEKASFEVACERIPDGLKVSIKDKGLPFDPNQIRECRFETATYAKAPEGCGISLMRDLMDEVFFNNLGPDGKETVLVKYFNSKNITDYYEACDLNPYPQSPTRHPIANASDIVVRQMNPSEAVEVSRCVYRSYGFSYSNEKAYYPDRMIKLNQSGQIYSAVAVTPAGEVVAHCALLRSHYAPRIAELGMAVVKPEYRSHGIFTRLTEFLVAKAKSENLAGLFGRAVSNHTFSQALAHRLGLQDCAILLGHLPQTASFKGITEKLPQRESLVVHFLYLRPSDHETLYPPSRHLDIIKKLYENVHAAPFFVEVNNAPAHVLPKQSVVKIKIDNALGFARVDVVEFGQDITLEVKTRLKELCVQRIDTINLYLDLRDPFTAVLEPTFEQLGFFFAGILPAEHRGDSLILQYLNNVPIDYSKIQLAAEAGKELLSYIRTNDPNTS